MIDPIRGEVAHFLIGSKAREALPGAPPDTRDDRIRVDVGQRVSAMILLEIKRHGMCARFRDRFTFGG